MLYQKYVKRLLDILLASILIFIFSPLFIIVGVLVYLKIGTPIIFKQVRPGINERLFSIYKFRTMTNEKDDEGMLLSDEQRLTKAGALLRNLSLDELPQLFNVLKGEMSFVGPRPLLVDYLTLYNKEQKRRQDVLPGITGWAQVNGRNSLSWDEKFEYDVWYVVNQSFFLDLKIIGMTILTVLKKSDVSSSSAVGMEKFEGNQSDG